MLVTWHYRPHRSLMESFDPRARWIFSLAFLFSATMFWDARFLAPLFLIGFGWYFSGKISWQQSKRGWYLVLTLLGVMIIVNTIITGGGAGGVVPEGGQLVWPNGFTLPLINHVFHFGLTWPRLWFALCQLMRISSIAAVFLIIPYTMDPRQYGVTFRRLGLPDRFSYSMELAFRYLPTLTRDFTTTLDAQRARGYEIERARGGLIKQIIRVAPLIVPVTMNSILMGEDITNAMDLRCFGQFPRTWLEKLQFRRWDYVLVILSVILLGLSILFSILGYGKFWVPAFWPGV